jgi:hypothetical protein
LIRGHCRLVTAAMVGAAMAAVSVVVGGSCKAVASRSEAHFFSGTCEACLGE